MLLKPMMARLAMAVGGAGLAGLAGSKLSQSSPRMFSCSPRFFGVSAQEDPTKAKTIYEFTVNSIDGEKVDLAKYKGQVCVVVNVASK